MTEQTAIRMPENNPIIDPATVNKRIDQFIMVRDALKKLEDEYDTKKKPLTDLKDRLSGWLQAHMDKTGAKSIRTDSGTCSATVRYTASLADADIFMRFVIDNGLYDLLDRRANPTSVRAYVENHDKLPPGVNLNAMKTVGVRRPTKKGESIPDGE